MARDFENLKVWQKSRKIVLLIYRIFNGNNDYSFRDQIRRASISIVCNIAEGYEKESDKELARYLKIAKGSAAEVRALLIISKDLGYITNVEYEEMNTEIFDILKMISGFINKLKGD